MEEIKFFAIRVLENGFMPRKGSEGAAGYDVFATFDFVLGPQQSICHPLNFQLALPPSGYYGRLAPRSGLALKHGIDVLAGVIDSDYRGNVQVILHNTDRFEEWVVKRGQNSTIDY